MTTVTTYNYSVWVTVDFDEHTRIEGYFAGSNEWGIPLIADYTAPLDEVMFYAKKEVADSVAYQLNERNKHYNAVVHDSSN